jgi:hypothetical protein
MMHPQIELPLLLCVSCISGLSSAHLRLVTWLPYSFARSLCGYALSFSWLLFQLLKTIAILRTIPIALATLDSPTYAVQAPACATSKTDWELLAVAALDRSALLPRPLQRLYYATPQSP